MFFVCISKKEPVSYDMIVKICEKYVCVNANLSELRVAAICVTAFYAYLRFNEIAGLRCCDLTFCTNDGVKFVELYIVKSKTDVYRNGSKSSVGGMDRKVLFLFCASQPSQRWCYGCCERRVE